MVRVKTTTVKCAEGVLTSLGLACLLAAPGTWTHAQQRGAGGTVAIDADDIGGVVTGPKGPEAGVWVVAETTDTPTRFIRSVVTDAQGRYVVPDLPKAKYQVFVRGYGLVDSPKIGAAPGQQLNLKAVPAPDARAAAQIYPAAYWLSLMEIPKGAMPEREVISAVKECLTCHQLGNLGTREIAKTLGSFPNSLAAWDHRVTVGPMGLPMSGSFQRFGEQRRMFAEWTDKIAAGAVPTQVPPRPSGLERNVVVTLWDWAVPTGGRSDGAASDDRIGTNNANGPVWGVIQSDDLLVSVDPATNRAEQIIVPTNGPMIGAYKVPSPHFPEAPIWQRKSDPRSVALDHHGRVWLTGRIRAAADAPGFCKPGSTNKFTSYFAVPRIGARQVMMYDPKTKQFTQIDTCFDADHNHFAENAESTLYFGQNNTLGWVDTATFDKTKNAEASQGWCPAVVDTTGDGKITQWTEPEQPADPAKDRRVTFGCYSLGVNKQDGGIWCAGIGPRDNKLTRIERGPDPPLTCKAEVFEPPPGFTPEVFRSGGVSVDSKGIVWLNWRGTDYMTSFDRGKCKTLNGPKATGQHCPEGWTVQIKPGPTFAGTTASQTPNNSDLLYLTHVDKANTLGLGPDVPVTGSVNTDSLLAFVPTSKQFVQLTVPYPMGFFARSAQGRIDDPRTGWKGRGFWSTYSSYIPWHYEGGKGTKPKLVKFQVRPNPLAK
jgi:hypothetical protein